MSEIELEKARKFARASVADFFLYESDKMDKGLLEDSLFKVMGEEIEASAKTFEKKFSSYAHIFWDVLFERLMQREAKLLTEKGAYGEGP